LETQTLAEHIDTLRGRAEDARTRAAVDAGGVALSVMGEIAMVPIHGDKSILIAKLLALVGGAVTTFDGVSSGLESAQAGREAAALMVVEQAQREQA
jgi:hypothetical protein